MMTDQREVTKQAAAVAVGKTIAGQSGSLSITSGQRRAILEKLSPGKKARR
jgi:hypothetical protein